MRQVAIAFATSKPLAAEGGRLSELVAVKLQDGAEPPKTLHLQFKTGDDEGAGKPTFAEAFPALDEFVGEAALVVHHAARWRRFLRPELRAVKKRGAKRLLTQTLDVAAWAHSRFPKQRKSLEAIAQRCELVTPGELDGLHLDAERLRLIAVLIGQTQVEQPAVVLPASAPPEVPEIAASVPIQAEGRWSRLVKGFRGLVGRG